jgi:hypothetical protein
VIGRRPIAIAAAAVLLVSGAGGVWALDAFGDDGENRAGNAGLSAREAEVSAQWKAPDAVRLEGRGSDTKRTHVALRIMEDDPPELDRPASHLRAILGRPFVIHHGATWQYRISVRARPFGESCTRYFTVDIRHRRVDGYEISPESCTDGSPGRDLPTR